MENLREVTHNTDLSNLKEFNNIDEAPISEALGFFEKTEL